MLRIHSPIFIKSKKSTKAHACKLKETWETYMIKEEAFICKKIGRRVLGFHTPKSSTSNALEA